MQNLDGFLGKIRRLENIMTEQLIFSQLYQLPENLKWEVLHYIEFLVKKTDRTRHYGEKVETKNFWQC
ncbi:hypothetical protein BGP_5515 [Beggiatoa sp. PS]|nr:hypothetical protein BGP_5515 [Beggiatoa sp. PS]